MIVPCRRCSDRVMGCHAKCERYKAFKAKYKELGEKAKTYRDASDAKFDGMQRMLKARNKAPKYNP